MSVSASTAGWRFLVDENLPPLLAQRLQAAGYYAVDVQSAGLSTQPDAVVFAHAQAHQLTILTLDKGLTNPLIYPPPHAGVVMARLSDKLSVTRKMDIILAELAKLAGQSLASSIVTIEPGQVRVRRSL